MTSIAAPERKSIGFFVQVAGATPPDVPQPHPVPGPLYPPGEVATTGRSDASTTAATEILDIQTRLRLVILISHPITAKKRIARIKHPHRDTTAIAASTAPAFVHNVQCALIQQPSHAEAAS